MTGYNEGRLQWMDEGFYPIAERVGGVGKDEVLIVEYVMCSAPLFPLPCPKFEPERISGL